MARAAIRFAAVRLRRVRRHEVRSVVAVRHSLARVAVDAEPLRMAARARQRARSRLCAVRASEARGVHAHDKSSRVVS